MSSEVVFPPLCSGDAVGTPQVCPWYLAITAFIESIFWPIPVDVMLAPMALGKPHRAWHYAALATLFSVLGALFGYLLGYALWGASGAAAGDLGWL